MGTEQVADRQTLVRALRYRNRLAKEVRDRVAQQGARSHCVFSGQGMCAVADHSHGCLLALRSRYAGARMMVEAFRKADPKLFLDEEVVRLDGRRS